MCNVQWGWGGAERTGWAEESIRGPLASPSHVALAAGSVRPLVVDNLLLLQRVVFEKLLNQVDVREHHSSAAVSLQLESVEGVTLRHVVVLEVRKIRLPFVADNLAARETSHWNDHCVCVPWSAAPSVSLVASNLEVAAATDRYILR